MAGYFGRFAVLLASVAILAAGAGPMQAAMLTFDDLSGTNNPIPDGYGGFSWGNFYYLDGVNYSSTSGYQNAVVSPNNVAYNAYGNPAFMSDSPFTFNSAYFTAAWNEGLSVTVEGYLASVLVHTNTFTINTTSPTLMTFDWSGIDELRFSSSGGTDNPNYSGSGTHFAMDNFVYNEGFGGAVPEPTTLAIWSTLTGLGLIAARRRRRKQTA